MKRLTAVLISLMMIFTLSTAFASSVPEIENRENCVVDMADVISQETEEYLSTLNKRLEDETGASIVIATVDFTGSMSVSEYAYEAFNKWGIGDKDKDNGLLLVMSIGQEDYFAAHGTGIEKALTASELDQMLWEYLEDDFADENYDEGAKSFYLAAYEWFGDYYDVNLSSFAGTDDGHDHGHDTVIYEENRGNGIGRIFIWIMLIMIVIILIAAFSDNKSQPKKVYRNRTHQRRGPHTSTFRRVTPPPASTRRSPFSSSGSPRSSSSTRTSSRSTTRSSTRSSSSRTSSSSRSSGRSGGFGGGSSRGGGAGRRK